MLRVYGQPRACIMRVKFNSFYAFLCPPHSVVFNCLASRSPSQLLADQITAAITSFLCVINGQHLRLHPMRFISDVFLFTIALNTPLVYETSIKFFLEKNKVIYYCTASGLALIVLCFRFA